MNFSINGKKIAGSTKYGDKDKDFVGLNI